MMKKNIFGWFISALFLVLWSNCDCKVQSENCGSIAEPTFIGSKVLDATDGFKMSWKINQNELFIKLEINALDSKGYMGIGIGEETSGSMLGADIVTVRINNGKLVVEDRNVPFDPYPIDNYSSSFPALDNCQDWEPVSAETTSTSWKAIIKRKLSTGDTQDRNILSSGSQRIIYAWSKTATSVQYHGNNRGTLSIDFSTNTQTIPIPADSATTIDLTMGSYSLPNTYDTYYTCKGFDISKHIDLTSGDRHIVRFDPIIQPGNEKYVHHMLLHACGTTSGSPYSTHSDGTTANVCGGSGNGNSPLAQGTCVTIVYGWAVGSSPLVLPNDVGVRIGTSATGFTTRYLLLEIHYDNAARDAGVVDSSGVKMYVTAASNTRTHDAAGLTLGMYGSPPNLVANTPNQHFEATCSAACTNKFNGPVTVFGSFLHMHAYGKKIWTTHYPGANTSNKVIRNRIDFWNFEFQQTTPVNYVINKGDKLSIHGIYDLTQSNVAVSFGEKSTQEMLFDFLFVYPASNLNGKYGCGTYANNGVSSCGVEVILEASPSPDGDTSLSPVFGPASGVCTIGTVAQSKNLCTPTSVPTKSPSKAQNNTPTKNPIKIPTKNPVKVPTKSPTKAQNNAPTKNPIKTPTKAPVIPTTKSPIKAPTKKVEDSSSIRTGVFLYSSMISIFLFTIMAFN